MSYFEVRGRRIVRAEVGAVHFCTDRKGGHRYDDEPSAFQAPIRISPFGIFRFRQVPDEIKALEVLQGEVEPTRITSSFRYSYGGVRAVAAPARSNLIMVRPGRAVPYVASRR